LDRFKIDSLKLKYLELNSFDIAYLEAFFVQILFYSALNLPSGAARSKTFLRPPPPAKTAKLLVGGKSVQKRGEAEAN